MHTNTKQTMNETTRIEWAGSINARWICHHELAECAAGWMKHLEASDPARLADSCRHAFELMMKAGPHNDPKPWFYAGLFSLATEEEQAEWLKEHAFTAAAVRVETDGKQPGRELVFQEQTTLNLLERLQWEVTLLREHPEAPAAFEDDGNSWIVEIPVKVLHAVNA